MIINSKCAKKKEVRDCEKCIRYRHCMFNEPIEFTDEALVRLGIKAIYAIVNDYENYYRKGWKSHCKGIEQILRTEQAEVLSLGEYDGIPILEGIKKQCYRKYGDLDELNKRHKEKVRSKITELENKKRLATTRKERFEIANHITRLKGELNF